VGWKLKVNQLFSLSSLKGINSYNLINYNFFEILIYGRSMVGLGWVLVKSWASSVGFQSSPGQVRFGLNRVLGKSW
jgi:hypothetical protein